MKIWVLEMLMKISQMNKNNIKLNSFLFDSRLRYFLTIMPSLPFYRNCNTNEGH